MTRRRPSSNTTAVALCAAAFVLAGCTGSPADRSGGDVLQLRMATIDGFTFGSRGGSVAGPEAFVSQLEELSGGRIHVELTTSYGSGAVDAEARLVKAIAAGELDGGWPATRAFAAAGIPGLEPLEAPMTLTNLEAVEEVVEGPVGQLGLDQLDDTGVVGLALADGGLRRPLATRPLTDLGSWQGARFRVFNSDVQTAAVSALGGRPVAVGPAWADEVAAGRLDGAEVGLDLVATAPGHTDAHEMALNVVLWPKLFVLAVSQDRFDSLDDEQRSWVTEAAARGAAASLAASDRIGDVDALCDLGVQFDLASDAELARLRTAVEPVVGSLRDDEENAELMSAVEAVAARHPEADAPPVPVDCGSRRPLEVVDVPTEPSELPNGVYRAEIPVRAVEDAGVDNNSGYSGTWTLEVRNGTYDITCRPLDLPDKDCGNTVSTAVLEAGWLFGAGDMAYFVSDAEVLAAKSGCSNEPDPGDSEPCAHLDPYGARWRVDGGELVFTDNQGPGSDYLVLRPWVRIASTG